MTDGSQYSAHAERAYNMYCICRFARENDMHERNCGQNHDFELALQEVMYILWEVGKKIQDDWWSLSKVSAGLQIWHKWRKPNLTIFSKFSKSDTVNAVLQLRN